MPGVIDSTTNYVEHPEVVANRIEAAVDAVGDRERVIAGVDCGFGTYAGYEIVAPEIVWEKLKALAAGARIATERLWGNAEGSRLLDDQQTVDGDRALAAPLDGVPARGRTAATAPSPRAGRTTR